MRSSLSAARRCRAATLHQRPLSQRPPRRTQAPMVRTRAGADYPDMPGGGAVFVYGTLMADEVLQVLLKRVPLSRPATLQGYTRRAVKGQVFPAIVPAAAGSGGGEGGSGAEGEAAVRGKVLVGLSPRELEILDGALVFFGMRRCRAFFCARRWGLPSAAARDARQPLPCTHLRFACYTIRISHNHHHRRHHWPPPHLSPPASLRGGGVRAPARDAAPRRRERRRRRRRRLRLEGRLQVWRG